MFASALLAAYTRDGRCTIQLTQFPFANGEDVSVFRTVERMDFISTMSINSPSLDEKGILDDKLICGIGGDIYRAWLFTISKLMVTLQVLKSQFYHFQIIIRIQLNSFIFYSRLLIYYMYIDKNCLCQKDYYL